jgi:ribA/ribD-fused uncharacterized protein
MSGSDAPDVIDSFSGPYQFLSNFYPSRVAFMGDLYPTVEHAYQAGKTDNDAERMAIRKAGTPHRAKKLGRQFKMRKDWEEIKEGHMRYLLRQKFMPGTTLAKWLLDTGDKQLIEGNTWGDMYWGICKGVGLNRLGIILMEIRGALR